MAELKEKELIIDDGRQKVVIKNLMGEEVGYFLFSPTDMGIIERFNEVAGKFDDVVEPLQNIGITATGEGVDEESIAGLAEAKKRLFDLIDYLFQGNMSEAFFGKINPFSPVGGNFYCVNAMNVISDFISKQFETETKKISKNLAKYTRQYKK